ncbi:3-deoxy-D-manno-octulosonate 8-phosphate phosphatase KdsC [Flavobacterium sp. TAB 87]|nr:3-deoxy-D-manno-octulosonate 8-phosphate phosphatase KdsC [Flavobacterium sp. TAB 87]
MLGRPLFFWVLSEAIFSELDEVFVFTDDTDIIAFIQKEYQWSSKVKAVLRSSEHATDTASTESTMLEFATLVGYDFDVLCLLQATSPLTTAADINAALKIVSSDGNDSALSVVNTHRFTWNADGTSQNYDVFNRPRRQDFEGLLIENGAVYATSKAAFLNSKNRVSGKIGLVKMQEDSLVEIDSMTDWKIVEELLAKRLKKSKKHQRINYLVLDVDGVFTNGEVLYSEKGELAKAFDMRDGMGLEILRQCEVEVVVLTSENSELVAQRMKKLQIENTFLGVKDKYAFLQQFISHRNTSFASFAYIGDDVNDLASMCAVGWSFAPANATEIIKQKADYLLTRKSAAGAIREACDKIIAYNERYD